MILSVRIPDDFAKRLGADGTDLERKVLEALVLQEYRGERMTTQEVRVVLGFDTVDDVDSFLKARGAFEPCSVDDINRQVKDLSQLGF